MNRTTPWKAIVPLFAAVLYGVSPIDLIPDLIPLLGFVDDALVVPILLLFAGAHFMAAKRRQQPIATIVQHRRRS